MDKAELIQLTKEKFSQELDNKIAGIQKSIDAEIAQTQEILTQSDKNKGALEAELAYYQLQKDVLSNI